MADDTLKQAARLDDEVWARLADLLRRFEASWQAASDAEIAQFLPARDDPLYPPALIELVKVDQEYRWRRGEHRTIEDYIAQWPVLADRLEVLLELLEAECVTRAVVDQLPAREELRRRFPALGDQIDLAKVAAEAKDDPPAAAGASPSAQTSEDGPGGRKSSGDDWDGLQVGAAFGRYAIRELLGRGAMGWVYRAYDSQLEREVALKVPHFEPSDDPAVIGQFLREGRAAAKIRHPNVLPVFDAGQIDGIYHITMALIEGQPLVHALRARKFSCREAATLVWKLAAGLDTVHKAGIVHRDIKPSNVMIDRSGEPVLMDFGLARPLEAGARQVAGESLLGTPAYMSPEQVRGEPVEAPSDIYGLGVLLYEMLAGQPPFSGPLTRVLTRIADASPPPPPQSLRPDLDLGLEAICLKAMAKSSPDRYPTAADLADALYAYLEGRPDATVGGPRPRAAVSLILGLAIAAILLPGLAILVQFNRTPNATPAGQPSSAAVAPDKPISVQGDADAIPGLVAWYKLDGNADDASAKGHHGSASGVRPTEDRFGRASRACAFDGESSQILVPDAPALNPTKGLTITAWFQPHSFRMGEYSWPTLVNKIDKGGYSLEIGAVYERRPSVTFIARLDGIGDGTANELGMYVRPGTWYFLAGAFDGEVFVQYLGQQGEPLAKAWRYLPGRLLASSCPLAIGSNPVLKHEDRHFCGVIDDVRIFDRALTEPEINLIYASPTPAAAPDPP
jgi:hypothetical protein